MGLYGDADLVATVGVPYTRTFQYQIGTVFITWANYNILSQARDRDGTLLFLLDPFMAPLGTDATSLVLTIPASMTYALPKEGKWDILAVHKTNGSAFRTPTPAGRVILLPGISRV